MKKNGEATLPPTHTWWSELNNGVQGIVLIMTASIVVGIGLFVLVRTSDDPKAAATLALGGTLLIVAAGFICNTCLCLHTCMRVAQVYDLRHWEIKKAEFDAKHKDFDWLDLDDEEDDESREAEEETPTEGVPAKVVAQQPEPADTSGTPKIGDTQELPVIKRQPRNVTNIFDPKAVTQRLPDSKAIQEELARREQAAGSGIVATATSEKPPCTALAIIRQDETIARAVQAIKTGESAPLTIVSQENHDSPENAPSNLDLEPEEDFETYLERKAEELRIPVSCLRSKLMAFNCEDFDHLPAYAQDDLRRLSA